MVNPDIEPVIQSAMQGNREAFTEIVRRYQSFAFQLAYGILHDRMEAEDAVQESFTKAFFSIKKLKSVYAFHSWLSRIVTNICLDRIKKRRATIQTEDIESIVDVYPSVHQEQLESMDRLSLQEAVAKLSPEKRAVVILREVHGFDYQEIANILSIPLGTVKSRLRDGRLQMRNFLLQQEDEEEI
ncbi:RNA polymerase sigma factor [Aneurinibacillus tyrosinisolvens]|uniref:RNA polymerase sigma factor n=1 Tax=Aneurinibacillus tyrosinisolvens TaxID=1443435 RepID=UPI00063F4550|nr:RNA polymerase sigma factor [Aneurinibacillus tyrosinisolvens]